MRSSEKKSLFKMCLPVVAGAFIFFIASCSKSNNNNNGGGGNVDTGKSYLAVVNASPGDAKYNVYSGSTNLTPSGQIGFGSATGVAGGSPYVTVVPGTDSIRLTSTTGSPYVVNAPFTFSSNDYYTLFVYDTVGSNGQLKTLLLNDPNTALTSGQAEIRFINLSPNSIPLYATLINGTDTVRENNVVYVGTSLLTIDSLSSFTTISPGTYNVQILNNEGNLITNIGSETFAANMAYTLYAKGYQNGLLGTDSLAVGIVQNH
jgi:hypothetical protein